MKTLVCDTCGLSVEGAASYDDTHIFCGPRTHWQDEPEREAAPPTGDGAEDAG